MRELGKARFERMILEYKKERGEPVLEKMSEDLRAEKEIAFTVPGDV